MSGRGAFGGPRIRPAPLTGWRSAIATALAIGGLSVTPRAGIGQVGPVDGTWPATGEAVSVRAMNVSIRVDAWDRDAVRILKADPDRRHKLEVARSPTGELSIDVLLAKPFDRGLATADTIFVTVPRRSPLSVRTYTGALSVVDVAGPVSLVGYFETIAYRGYSERVMIDGFHAAIAVEAPGANEVSVESGGGDVRVETGGGEVRIETVRGDIDVFARGPLTRAAVESTSGSIAVDASFAPGGTIVLDTHRGDLALAIRDRTSATFEAETFRGAIENDVGPSHPRAASGAVRANRVVFTLGAGEARVRASSFLGDIRFRVAGEMPVEGATSARGGPRSGYAIVALPWIRGFGVRHATHRTSSPRF